MDYEQDYVMRMIKDMVRALALLIFGKRDIRYEIPEENARTEEDDLYTRILQMADRGEINEAENILLTELPKESSNYVVMAADFYQHIADTIIAEMKFWKVWKVLPGNTGFWTEIFVWRFRKGGFGT